MDKKKAPSQEKKADSKKASGSRPMSKRGATTKGSRPTSTTKGSRPTSTTRGSRPTSKLGSAKSSRPTSKLGSAKSSRPVSKRERRHRGQEVAAAWAPRQNSQELPANEQARGKGCDFFTAGQQKANPRHVRRGQDGLGGERGGTGSRGGAQVRSAPGADGAGAVAVDADVVWAVEVGVEPAPLVGAGAGAGAGVGVGVEAMGRVNAAPPAQQKPMVGGMEGQLVEAERRKSLAEAKLQAVMQQHGLQVEMLTGKVEELKVKLTIDEGVGGEPDEGGVPFLNPIEALRQELEDTRQQVDDLVAEKATLNSEKSALVGEKEAAVVEKERLISENAVILEAKSAAERQVARRTGGRGP